MCGKPLRSFGIMNKIVREDFIGTYTNKKFYFLNPMPEQIDIEDIAHALSMNCRYNGHIKKFYSVAEHCCNVAAIVYDVTKNPKMALAALMHDASEAYIVDIPRPLKPHLTNYKEIEEKVEKAIQDKWNLVELDSFVHWVDQNIVYDEAVSLFNVIPDWVSLYTPVGVKLGDGEPLHIQGFPCETAKQVFLDIFNELAEEINNVQ